MSTNIAENTVIHNYRLYGTISKGAFGTVYKAQHIRKPAETAAVKIEFQTYGETNVLKHETKILQHLQQNGVRRVPIIYWYGMHMNWPVLIIPLYTCSIEDYAKHKVVSVKQLVALAIKCMRILENIHRYYVVHRDIKPSNFMIRNGDIYLIDFGLATFYLDESGEHYADSEVHSLVGTAKYTSIHVHCGHRYTRRDDIISLGYVLMFLSGLQQTISVPSFLFEKIAIPASNLHKSDIQHPLNQHLLKRKIENLQECISICEQLDRDNIISVIANYLKWAYAISYSERPNYVEMIAKLEK